MEVVSKAAVFEAIEFCTRNNTINSEELQHVIDDLCSYIIASHSDYDGEFDGSGEEI